MKAIKNKEIETYIKSLSDFQRGIVLAMRGTVLSTDSKVQEGIKWGSIAFFNNKNICGFRIAKTHVTLLFMEGALLKDEHNILEGNGAKARTYKAGSISEINSKALSKLVKESLELGM